MVPATQLTMSKVSPAQVLVAKADKKYGSSTGWFSSSTTKYEEAGDLYQYAMSNDPSRDPRY